MRPTLSTVTAGHGDVLASRTLKLQSSSIIPATSFAATDQQQRQQQQTTTEIIVTDKERQKGIKEPLFWTALTLGLLGWAIEIIPAMLLIALWRQFLFRKSDREELLEQIYKGDLDGL